MDEQDVAELLDVVDLELNEFCDDEEEIFSIVDRFNFHSPSSMAAVLHDKIREQHALLAVWIMRYVPPGRHQALALTSLQEAMMWANAAVANDYPESKL